LILAKEGTNILGVSVIVFSLTFLLRRSTRYAIWGLLAVGMVVLPVLLLERPSMQWMVLLGIAFVVYSLTFLIYWMRQALYGPRGRSLTRAVLVAVAASLLVPGAAFGLCLFISRDTWSTVIEVLPLFPLAVALTWIPLVLVAYLTSSRCRYQEEWAALQVD
jgi:hypothetical protein